MLRGNLSFDVAHLLAGSLVAFIVIAATMFATRGVDWYGRGVAETRAENT